MSTTSQKTSVALPLETPRGEPAGTLLLQLLPRDAEAGQDDWLRDERGTSKAQSDQGSPIQLMEGHEYRFELQFDGATTGSRVALEPSELFDRDTRDGHTGRLRTGLYVGTLRVEIRLDDQPLAPVFLEVRSRKLSYRTDYRRMLSDLTNFLSEIVLQRFSPNTQWFSLDPSKSAESLYPKFAFLQSLLEGEDFRASLRRILDRPYLEWERASEIQPAGRGARASRHVIRQMSQAGARVSWQHSPHDRVETLPAEFENRRHESSLDNVPNRFVKHALHDWHGFVRRIVDLLESERESGRSGPVDRGIREARDLLSTLEEFLGDATFREVGRLQHFPAENQVLQKRAGYRDIFKAYFQSQMAVQLAWDGGETVFGAGQRDVATLYEYWVFVRLAELIAELCEEPLDVEKLVEPTNTGLNLKLTQGTQQLVTGGVIRGGRRLELELWFNRTFSNTGDESERDSWSRRMRPDVSLKINDPDGSETRKPVWLHFDAKYRVKQYREALGEGDERGDAEAAELLGAPKRPDLLKMHAYRDAIRRSAGAYVVFPGTDREQLREFYEVLPGLGAFPLRPSDGKRASGAGSILDFIDKILDHLADPTKSHERARFWHAVSYEKTSETADQPTPASELQGKPPADSDVLLVEVDSEEERRRIDSEGRYLLPVEARPNFATQRALGAAFLVVTSRDGEGTDIYRCVGDVQITERADGPVFVFSVEAPAGDPADDLLAGLEQPQLVKVRQRRYPETSLGAPVVMTLYDLAAQL